MVDRELSYGERIITTNSEVFRVLEKIGSGGFSDVYRAEHDLPGGGHEYVLIKAFIRRDNRIDDKEWNNYINHEFEVNELVRRYYDFPGILPIKRKLTANDGRIYGLMSEMRNGLPLSEYVRKDQFVYSTFQQKIALMRRILLVVARFHEECEMVHGDISPWNIFVYDTIRDEEELGSIALLDFGNAHPIGDSAFTRSGYTPGFATNHTIMSGITTENDDIQSTLRCIWYCLTSLTGEDSHTQSTSLPRTAEQVHNVHSRIMKMDVEAHEGDISLHDAVFLEKHRKKFDLVEHYLESIFLVEHDTDTLLDYFKKTEAVLTDSGINPEIIGHNIFEEYQSIRENGRFRNIDIIESILPEVKFKVHNRQMGVYREGSKHPEQLHTVMRVTQDSLFLIGSGGMGKTTSLINIMDKAWKEGNQSSVYAFMELCTLSQDDSEWYDDLSGGTFIEQFLGSYLTQYPREYLPKNSLYVNAIHQELFKHPEDEKKKYVLLLDGLNELTFENERSRKHFFDTLSRYLKYADNLRIIMTGRNDTGDIDSEIITRLHTEGLDDENVERILKEAVQQSRLDIQDYERLSRNRSSLDTNEYRLWQCLRTPFFLIMYCFMSDKISVTRQGEILRNFFHDKRMSIRVSDQNTDIYGENPGGERRYRGKYYSSKSKLDLSLCMQIILDLLLPEIAISMAGRNLFYINHEDFLQIIETAIRGSRYGVRSYNWIQTSFGYNGNIQKTLDAMYADDKGERIAEIVCSNLSIMRATANRAYFFTHQYFRDYFAACAYINRFRQFLECRISSHVTGEMESDDVYKILYPFHETGISIYISTLIGEILDECKNLPVYDPEGSQWLFQKPVTADQTLLSQMLDCYRMHMQRRQGPRSKRGLTNLIDILKHSRIQNNGSVDFTGIDFKNLDLTDIALSGIIFSRFGREPGSLLTTDFAGSTGAIGALLSSDNVRRMECLAAGKEHRVILLQDPYSGEVREYDLEHGETIQIATGINEVRYATYLSGTDDIILVASCGGGASPANKKKASLIKRMIDAFRLNDYELDEDDELYYEELRAEAKRPPRRSNETEGAKAEKTLVDVLYYCREAREINAQRFADKNYLWSEWSDRLKVFSLLLREHSGKWELSEMLYIGVAPKGSSEREGKYWQTKTYPLSVPDEFTAEKATDGLLFAHYGDGQYIFGNTIEYKGNIALWNKETNSCVSLCYMRDQIGENQLRGIWHAPYHGATYILDRDYNLIRTHSVKYNGKDDNYVNMTVPGSWMEYSRKTNTMLVYDGIRLHLWDLNNHVKIWESREDVWSAVRASSYIIANCGDSLFQIDPVKDTYTLVQKYDTSVVLYTLGSTSDDGVILLCDSTGLIRWFNLKSVTCYRLTHILLPEGDFTSFQFYGDVENGVILGLRRHLFYCWDAYSGRTIGTEPQNIAWPDGCRHRNEQIWNGKALFTFELDDYSVFPVKRSFQRIIWNRENVCWENGEQLPEVLSRYNNGLSEVRISKDGTKAGLLFKLDDAALILCLEKEEREAKKIVVREEDKLLGVSNKGYYYSNQNNGDDTSVFFSSFSEQMEYDIGVCIPDISSNIVSGDYLAVIDGPINEQKALYIWNIYNEQVNEVSLIDGIAAAGVKGLEQDTNATDEQKILLEGQGALTRTHSESRKAVKIEHEKASVLIQTRERMRIWDIKVLFMVVLMSVISCVCAFKRILPYRDDVASVSLLLSENTLRIVLCAMCIIVARYFAPVLVDLVRWHEIHLTPILFVFTLAVLAVLFITLGSDALGHIPIFTAVLGTLPLLVCFVMYRPRKSGKSKLAVALLSIMYILVIIWQETYRFYSTVLLLQLAMTVVFTVFYSEYCKNKRRAVNTTIKAVVALAIISTGVLFVTRIIGVYPGDWLTSSLEDWNGYMPYIRSVVAKARIIGPIPEKFLGDLTFQDDYAYLYFINGLIRNYGWLAGISGILLEVILIAFMYKGSRNQSQVQDRCICMSATFFIFIQFIFALFPNLGLQIIPPYVLPFLGMFPLKQRSAWTALGVYCVFYKAHIGQETITNDTEKRMLKGSLINRYNSLAKSSD